MDTKSDPLDREIDIAKLRRTKNPRGFYADKISEDNRVLIKPEILKHFNSIEEINSALQEYLNRRIAQ
ncbi:MAG: hypothetical protein ACWA5U_08920 [bacterium]